MNRTRDVDRSVSGDSGNAETSALLERHGVGQWGCSVQRNHGVLGGGAKRTIGLRSVAPYAAPQPFGWDSVTYLVHHSGAIAMGNDPRVRHAISEGILPLLDVARIDARYGNAKPDFSGARERIGHIANR